MCVIKVVARNSQISVAYNRVSFSVLTTQQHICLNQELAFADISGVFRNKKKGASPNPKKE